MGSKSDLNLGLITAEGSLILGFPHLSGLLVFDVSIYSHNFYVDLPGDLFSVSIDT